MAAAASSSSLEEATRAAIVSVSMAVPPLTKDQAVTMALRALNRRIIESDLEFEPYVLDHPGLAHWAILSSDPGFGRTFCSMFPHATIFVVVPITTDDEEFLCVDQDPTHGSSAEIRMRLWIMVLHEMTQTTLHANQDPTGLKAWGLVRHCLMRDKVDVGPSSLDM